MEIPQKMKAARFYNVNEPLKIEEVPVPQLKDDEVLVQLKAVGLCGSDIHIAYEGVTATDYQPIILGHEPSGIVVQTGANVQGWEIGTRVSVFPIIYCGSCPNCISGHSEICYELKVLGVHRDGGLAEYMAIPAKNLVKLPNNIPFTIGAIITDAVATPFHALIDRAQLRAGESVAIFGAGGLGLHAVQIARMAGAKQIIVVDVKDEQLERAKQLGADISINSKYESPVEVIKKSTNGYGVDVAAEFVGLQETIKQAAASAGVGGRVVVSGIGPEPIQLMATEKFVRKQLSLHGSFGLTKQTVEQLAALAGNGRMNLEDSITHTFPLYEVNTALHYLHEKIENPTRIVITFE
ncbi:zinc-dependent alcohol dehydrogenase [Alkalihalobacterium elongatum]|uniref:zinc-dependent alcohol dehydrogenase n=1 Tax=Alkalihalobacterium elongatum TaxID=2675466 RepID=UPI001C1FB8A1|nr:zinc-binding dehydrogenase [Alkalihalobacterium elongatum]